jgi:predicted DNA-binding transcriptional regulator AlpA
MPYKTKNKTPVPGRLLSKTDVAQLLHVSVQTLNIYLREGIFPRPFKVAGTKCQRWRRSTIDRYLAKMERASLSV